MCPENSCPLFSLIICTIGRTGLLRELFNSLRDQAFKNFEVILVDQSETSEIKELCLTYPDLAIHYIHSCLKGLSNARNLGLSRARGLIISFPDDDCIYPADVLDKAHILAIQHPSAEILNGNWVPTLHGRPIGRNQEGAVGFLNFHRQIFSITIFVRAHVFAKIGRFDSRLGVGSQFGAGEETDMVIRALAAKMTIIQCEGLDVIHAAPPEAIGYGVESITRVKKYGSGLGFVAGKHLFSKIGFRLLPYAFTCFFRPFAGIFMGIARMNLGMARYYGCSFCARTKGLFFSIAFHNKGMQTK